MTKIASLTNDQWLLLLQLYLRKPAGVKPMYSKAMVKLSLELHLPPEFLHKQMFRLRQLDTPHLERLWNTYSSNPDKLERAVKFVRGMAGFNHPSLFYEGVDMEESFEKTFKPLVSEPRLMPMDLVIILDLYFRLTPNTMVDKTPEVADLAKRLRRPSSLVTTVMRQFQLCDPYLRKVNVQPLPLLADCQSVWNKYVNEQPEKLSATAALLTAYYK